MTVSTDSHSYLQLDKSAQYHMKEAKIGHLLMEVCQIDRDSKKGKAISKYKSQSGEQAGYYVETLKQVRDCY